MGAQSEQHLGDGPESGLRLTFGSGVEFQVEQPRDQTETARLTAALENVESDGLALGGLRVVFCC